MRGRWDAKNSPRDYGIARNLRSGLRGLKNPIGDPLYEVDHLGLLDWPVLPVSIQNFCCVYVKTWRRRRAGLSWPRSRLEKPGFIKLEKLF